MQKITFNLSPKLRRAIKAMAKVRGCSVSAFIRNHFERALAKKKGAGK